jgi:hypothetical protein
MKDSACAFHSCQTLLYEEAKWLFCHGLWHTESIYLGTIHEDCMLTSAFGGRSQFC